MIGGCRTGIHSQVYCQRIEGSAVSWNEVSFKSHKIEISRVGIEIPFQFPEHSHT